MSIQNRIYGSSEKYINRNYNLRDMGHSSWQTKVDMEILDNGPFSTYHKTSPTTRQDEAFELYLNNLNL